MALFVSSYGLVLAPAWPSETAERKGGAVCVCVCVCVRVCVRAARIYAYPSVHRIPLIFESASNVARMHLIHRAPRVGWAPTH